MSTLYLTRGGEAGLAGLTAGGASPRTRKKGTASQFPFGEALIFERLEKRKWVAVPFFRPSTLLRHGLPRFGAGPFGRLLQRAFSRKHTYPPSASLS